MAEFTDQPTNSLLPGEPWNSAKALACFENPIAIAEGAPGAPKVEPHALAGLFLARGSATRTIGGSSTTLIMAITDLDEVSEIIVFASLSMMEGATTSRVQVSTSTNNGSSWGDWEVFVGIVGIEPSDYEASDLTSID